MTQHNIENFQYEQKLEDAQHSNRVYQTRVACLLLALLSACGGGDYEPTDSSGNTYSLSGTLTGLNTGNWVTLLNSGTDELQLAANGPFAFPTAVKSNASYAVTVGTQPAGQKCSVVNGIGTAPVNVSNIAVSCVNSPLVVTTWAGSGQAGSADGVGVAASFNRPQNIAVDTAGNVYVADSGNNLVRKILPSGQVVTLAGSGSAGLINGPSLSAAFKKPAGVAVSANGNVYVADWGNHSIRMISADGTVSTLAGSGTAGYNDGTGTAALFKNPYGLAADLNGNVYVADSGNNRIRKISPNGAVITLAGSGSAAFADGTGSAASFNNPVRIVVATDGNAYVADQVNNRIRKITPDGVVSTFAGSGNPGAENGIGTAASFNYPYGVDMDAAGNVYVADRNNNLIRKISQDGAVSTVAGSGNQGASDGPATQASFKTPQGVAVGANGTIYVSDFGNNVIRKIEPSAN